MRAALAALALLLLAACAGQAPSISPDVAVRAFEAAGLSAANVTTTDVLPAPIASNLGSCQGARFDVEGDKGARLVICSDASQAETLAGYYEALGKDNPMFFSHVHRSGGLVMQMNGELPVETFQQYVEALP